MNFRFLIAANFVVSSLFVLTAEGQKFSYESQISNPADDFWLQNPPKPILISPQTSDTLNRSVIESERIKNKLIDIIVKQEQYARELRNFGIRFWEQFPNDNRRFLWLLKSAGPSPCYWKDINEGAKDYYNGSYSAEIDTAEREIWMTKFSKFREEFMNSTFPTEEMRDELREEEFNANYVYLKWKGAVKRSGFDFDRLIGYILDYAPHFFLKYGNSAELLNPLFWRHHCLTMCIDELFDESTSLLISLDQMTKFLEVIASTEFPIIQNQAQEKLSLMKLRSSPFNLIARKVGGSKFDLSDVKRKYILIDIWSTNCSSCISKMPEIKNYYEKKRSDNFEVISVCLNPQKDSTSIISIYNRIAAKWPLLIVGGKNWSDTNSIGNRLLKKYGFKTIPQLLLLDSNKQLIAYNGGLLAPGEFEQYINGIIRPESTNKEHTADINIGDDLHVLTSTNVGSICPYFRLQTPKRDSLSLNFILTKGKITLIDFWASWCIPCRMQIPFIRRIYNDFHGKGLCVVGFSIDENRMNWISAIKSDKMNWYQVCSLKGWNSEVALQFDLSHIPQTLVVNHNGEIVAKNLFGEELYRFIRNALID